MSQTISLALMNWRISSCLCYTLGNPCFQDIDTFLYEWAVGTLYVCYVHPYTVADSSLYFDDILLLVLLFFRIVLRGYYTEKDASVCVKEMLDAIRVSFYLT